MARSDAISKNESPWPASWEPTPEPRNGPYRYSGPAVGPATAFGLPAGPPMCSLTLGIVGLIVNPVVGLTLLVRMVPTGSDHRGDMSYFTFIVVACTVFPMIVGIAAVVTGNRACRGTAGSAPATLGPRVATAGQVLGIVDILVSLALGGGILVLGFALSAAMSSG